MVESSQIKIKILFLGDNNVGKTSLINKYVFDIFNFSIKPTSTLDNLSKTISANNKTLSLNLISLNGHDQFKRMTIDYIKMSSLVVIVFDITNKQSFMNANIWAETAKYEKPGIKVLYVGNKADKGFLRTVMVEEAEELAGLAGAEYIETSAYTGENVKEMIRIICKMINAGSERLPGFKFNERNQFV